MRQFLFQVFVVICIAILAGCSSLRITASQQQFAACKQVCETQRMQCTRICDDGCMQCTKKSYNQMVRRYARYKYEQNIRGEFLMRDLHSYADPLQCTKISCECSAEYAICMQSCEGKIRKRLEVVPKCIGC